MCVCVCRARSRPTTAWTTGLRRRRRPVTSGRRRRRRATSLTVAAALGILCMWRYWPSRNRRWAPATPAAPLTRRCQSHWRRCDRASRRRRARNRRSRDRARIHRRPSARDAMSLCRDRDGPGLLSRCSTTWQAAARFTRCADPHGSTRCATTGFGACVCCTQKKSACATRAGPARAASFVLRPVAAPRDRRRRRRRRVRRFGRAASARSSPSTRAPSKKKKSSFFEKKKAAANRGGKKKSRDGWVYLSDRVKTGNPRQCLPHWSSWPCSAESW